MKNTFGNNVTVEYKAVITAIKSHCRLEGNLLLQQRNLFTSDIRRVADNYVCRRIKLK
jgi:hypothetical protein